jgi:hypothetical protein
MSYYIYHIFYIEFVQQLSDSYIAEKTNCENKFKKELPLFKLQIFLLRVWFQKDIKQCRSVQCSDVRKCL